jgi:hypothetical protein
MNQIEFVSLATGQTAMIPASAVSSQEVEFMRSAILASGAELGMPAVELVVERPHHPEDPGKIEEGALIYFLRKPGTDGVITGAMVCWDETYSEEAWRFVTAMQESSDVVGLGCDRPAPSVPWSAGFCTSEWAEQSPQQKRQLADLDVSLAWACV